MRENMGAFGKLLAILVLLLVSYVLFALVVAAASSLVVGLGLNPTLRIASVQVGNDVLLVSSFAAITIFFTIPSLLAVFGKSGPWFRLIARNAKGLLATFGGLFLVYVGTAAIGRMQVAPFPGGAPIALLLLVGLATLGLVSRRTFLTLIERMVGVGLQIPSLVTHLFSGPLNTAAIELRLTPTKQIRQKSDERVLQEEALRFQRFARALGSLKMTTEFKMSFRKRRGKVLFLGRGRDSVPAIEQQLLAVAKAYFPETQPAPTSLPPEEGPTYTVQLTGAPEPSPNPLEPLARFFVETGAEGDYRVILRSHKRNPLSSLIARREQRRLAKKAAIQRNSPSLGGDQTTISVRDQYFGMELEEAVKEVERHASPQSVETWVYITGRGETIAKAMEVTLLAERVALSTLSGHRKASALKDDHIGRALEDLIPRGRPSVILPSEVSSFLWVPQMAIGVEITPAVEFELPPPLEGEICLGEVVLPSGKSEHEVRMPLDDLTTHVYLTGRTGSGKTTSAFNLLLQLYDHGIPFLIIEPVKTEYRSLSSYVKSLQVFTPGEDVAPFKLNIFEPPPGVSIKTHLDSLEAAWNSSFTMYAPLPYVMKRVLVETYRSCNWDIRNDKRGRPIMLADFRRTAESVARKLGYEPNVTMNIESALRVRIDNLEQGKQGDLFNTVASTPFETTLRKPTVIELKSISHPEEKAFVAALLLSNLATYLEAKGQSKSLRHVTLIEEAHRLLPNISASKGDPEGADSRKVMVEHFGNMLAEVRAYGEGLIVVEQIPTKILPDAIKNTATKIVHLVPAFDDRAVVAGAMGMSEEQSQFLTALKPGEAIVHLQRHPLPVRIAVHDRPAELGMKVGETDDEAVKMLMADYYLKNPQPKLPVSALRDKIQELVDNEWFRLRFKEGYDEVLTRHSPDKFLDLVTKAALRIASDQYEFAEITQKLLQTGTEYYLPLDERDRERFPREVMAFMARADRDVRRG